MRILRFSMPISDGVTSGTGPYILPISADNFTPARDELIFQLDGGPRPHSGLSPAKFPYIWGSSSLSITLERTVKVYF